MGCAQMVSPRASLNPTTAQVSFVSATLAAHAFWRATPDPSWPQLTNCFKDESSMQRETLGTLQTSVALSDTLMNREKEMIEAALQEIRGRSVGGGGEARHSAYHAEVEDQKAAD